MNSELTALLEEFDERLERLTAIVERMEARETARVTPPEFDAFAARVRANLALLEKEGER